MTPLSSPEKCYRRTVKFSTFYRADRYVCCRAYKLRHFLRGSGASETESDRSVRPPAVESTNDDAAQQSAPLSAVDRLSLNPERGILKNSSTNSITRREGSARESKSMSAAYQPVVGVNDDDKCPVSSNSGSQDLENSGLCDEPFDGPTFLEPGSKSDELFTDVLGVDQNETSTSNLPSSGKLRQSPNSILTAAVRTSPLPNSIHNSCND
jgi:hypothetical protein